MKQFFIIFILSSGLYANIITPNEVYAQAMRIENEMHILHKHYGVNHNHDEFIKKVKVRTNLQPRNVWQKTYEIMIKINILRVTYGLPIFEPVNLAPVLALNPDLVYEQTQRILTELKIFKFRIGIKESNYKVKKYTNKTSLDVYNILNNISNSLDVLNKSEFTPSYVFGESMRVYDDLSILLRYLNIKDTTIPSIRKKSATSHDTFNIAMQALSKVSLIQSSVGIEPVNFSGFLKQNPNSSDVFTMVQMIIAELQTIKAFIGLDDSITPAARRYENKTPADVHQLMGWNLRKIQQIQTLSAIGSK